MRTMRGKREKKEEKEEKEKEENRYVSVDFRDTHLKNEVEREHQAC